MTDRDGTGDGAATPAEDAPDTGRSTDEPAEGGDDKPAGGGGSPER